MYIKGTHCSMVFLICQSLLSIHFVPIPGFKQSKMQIFFYEDKNFQGRHYECTSDNPNLSYYLSRCNSIRVVQGSWMIYERTNYNGYQYFIKRGEYPNFTHWMGFNNSIKSCIAIPKYRGSYRLRLYERNNFGGKMLEATNDCSSVSDLFNHHDIQSCNVFDGYWIFYELSNFKGRQYYLRPGEYRRFTDWGSHNARVGSFKQISEFS